VVENAESASDVRNRYCSQRKVMLRPFGLGFEFHFLCI